MVVYNAIDTIEFTINSIVNQNYKNIQFIVVDGGSTDGTEEILHKYSENIYYWISEPDCGIYDALNKGIKIASGDWILFIGADDTLNNVIHDIVPQLKVKNCVYYGNAYMQKSKISYAGKFNIFKIAHQNICHQAMFYPKAVFDYYKYNLNNKVHADFELNLLIYSDKRFVFEFIEQVICNYSENGYSTFNEDNFYSFGRFKLLKARFPYYVYLYASIRHWITKLIKG